MNICGIFPRPIIPKITKFWAGGRENKIYARHRASHRSLRRITRLGAAESLPRKHLVTTTQPPSRFGSTSNRFREGLLEAIPPAVAKPRFTNIVSRSESLREQLVAENALSYVLWSPENYIFLTASLP